MVDENRLAEIRHNLGAIAILRDDPSIDPAARAVCVEYLADVGALLDAGDESPKSVLPTKAVWLEESEPTDVSRFFEPLEPEGL